MGSLTGAVASQNVTEALKLGIPADLWNVVEQICGVRKVPLTLGVLANTRSGFVG